jgi:hypothetical protein
VINFIIQFVVIQLVPLKVWGHAVVQLVEALCYRPEDRGFDS